MKIYFDGGCRPNPGRMEIAVVAAGKVHVVEDAGQGSSEQAEWLALISALEVATAMSSQQPGLGNFVLIGDARHVVDQANGSMRCLPANAGHCETVRQLRSAIGTVRIRAVKRSQNLAGIALARLHPR